MKRFSVFLLLVLSTSVTHAAPTVIVTGMPAWNPSDPGNLYPSGGGMVNIQVSGLTGSPTNYVADLQTYVPGVGWTSKPYETDYLTPLTAAGTASILSDTGGIDPVATYYYVTIYPQSATVPFTGGAVSPATGPGAICSVAAERPASLYGPGVTWSGYTWIYETTYLAASQGSAVGPYASQGGQYFTNSPSFIYEDSSGHMNLKAGLNTNDNNYVSTEMINSTPTGYGIYSVTYYNPQITTASTMSMFLFSPLGFGTSRNPNKEIDAFEFQSPGNTNPSFNADFCVQPYTTTGNLQKILIPVNTVLIDTMDWEPNHVSFTITTSSGTPVASWNYTGGDIPTPANDDFINFNNWWNSTPTGLATTDFVLYSFSYTPTPVWNVSTSGSWNTPGNWSTNTVPNGAGRQAVLGAGPATPTTVTLDSAQTLGTLTFDNTASYTLAAGNSGSLTLENTGTFGGQIVVVNGTHTIAAPLVIAGSGAIVTISGSSGLNISGNISQVGGSQSLTLAGGGELFLSGSDRYAGGTIVIDGTLVAASAYALPNGTSSTVGGTFIFDPAMAGAPMALVAAASQINPVPEPGTLVLLSVAVCGVAIYQRVCLRRKKR